MFDFEFYWIKHVTLSKQEDKMKDTQIWNADLGNGNYRNPILYTDYSDPDVVRVGSDYFMVASSFCNVPAIPVLHSTDLVNWRVVSYVLNKLPSPKYDMPAHGHGVWAPAIRYHDDKFWVCYPMPDEGIFMSTTTDPFGEWSEPFAVREGSGWIDPCPFWDDDGKAYLVSAFAKSRCGIKSILNLAEMKWDGTGLINDGRHIFDGHNTQPTIEGPKLYKRGDYYYILAPAGSVKSGWQTALRSKNIWGPYEEKIVMYQGGTPVNGPHQGGLIDTPDGEWWFIHFQDVGVCGRIVHLQPVRWIDDWPVIGNETGETCGTPVLNWPKPKTSVAEPYSPANSDDFKGEKLGLQWQWNANPKPEFYALRQNRLTLFAKPSPKKYCDAPNILLQKFDSPAFSVTTQINTENMKCGSIGGLFVLGNRYTALGLERTETGLELFAITGNRNDDSQQRHLLQTMKLSGTFYLKFRAEPLDRGFFQTEMRCIFSFGLDGEHFADVFEAEVTAGRWVGAKHGLFCFGKNGSIDVCDYIVEMQD